MTPLPITSLLVNCPVIPRASANGEAPPVARRMGGMSPAKACLLLSLPMVRRSGWACRGRAAGSTLGLQAFSQNVDEWLLCTTLGGRDFLIACSLVALGLVGAPMQQVLRNPLASPTTRGGIGRDPGVDYCHLAGAGAARRRARMGRLIGWRAGGWVSFCSCARGWRRSWWCWRACGQSVPGGARRRCCCCWPP